MELNLIILLVALFIGFWVVQDKFNIIIHIMREHKNRPYTFWEHKVSKKYNEHLGEEGWQLVSVLKEGKSEKYFYKRSSSEQDASHHQRQRSRAHKLEVERKQMSNKNKGG